MILDLILISLSSINSYAIDEKVLYQLVFKSYDIDQKEEILKDTQKGIGGIHLIWGSHSKEDTKDLINKIYQHSTGIKPFIAIDYEGGSVFLHQTHGFLNLPSNMAIAKSSDTENTYMLFYLLGLEVKKAGINMLFAPTADVNTNPRNPIINIRAFSDDPITVYKFTKSALEGISAAGIVGTIKHFPGHGMVDVDSHIDLPQTSISPIELYENHIYPFKKVIEEKKCDVVMVSHILYKMIDKEYPASMSEIIMRRILREQLKFEGIIITDSLDMKAISQNYPIDDAGVISLKNGADMILIGRFPAKRAVRKIRKAVDKGVINIDEILEKYERIRSIKEKYQVRESTTPTDDFDLAYKKIANEISLKSIKPVKCEGIKRILNSQNLDILFIVPQRYLKETIPLYSALKQINRSTTMYTDINKIKSMENRSNSSIIVAGYFWPYISEKKAKEIIEIREKYESSIYVNLLNPYDSGYFLKDFNCIIETYGINEFSINALTTFIKETITAN